MRADLLPHPLQDVARVIDGRIVEHWGVPDRFALLAQTVVLNRLAGPTS